MSLLIRLISGSTRILPLEDAPTLDHLYSYIVQYESIPSHLLLLTSNGHLVTDSTLTSHHLIPITCSLKLLGGKGGFGSLLRAATTKIGSKKTTNYSACRDLNGRRLRHVEAEEKLATWSSKTPSKAENKATRQKYKNIKDGKALEKKPCPWGAKCKYQYKCKLSHPLDPVKEAQKQKRHALTHLGQHFGDDQRLEDSDDEDSTGRMMSAVESGLKLAAQQAKQPKSVPQKRKVAKVYGVDDDDDEEEEEENEQIDEIQEETKESLIESKESQETAIEEQPEPDSDDDMEQQAEAYAQSRQQQREAKQGQPKKKQKIEKTTETSETQSPAPKTKTTVTSSKSDNTTSSSTSTSKSTSSSTSSSSASTSSSSSSKSETKEPTPTSFPPIDLTSFTTVTDLHTFTLPHLAHELSRHGLKSGGTLKERTDRLWLLKDHKIEDIPKKHKAVQKS